jgi:hypothetical protein
MRATSSLNWLGSIATHMPPLRDFTKRLERMSEPEKKSSSALVAPT